MYRGAFDQLEQSMPRLSDFANLDLVFSTGILQLQSRPNAAPTHRPIDLFFRSLAREQKHRSVGIVLSGTDFDGTLGLNAIKGSGVITLVQDERTARFEDTPRSAIKAVDAVRAPGEMGAEPGRIGRAFAASGSGLIDGVTPDRNDQQALSLIFVQAVSGVDFTRYKHTTTYNFSPAHCPPHDCTSYRP